MGKIWILTGNRGAGKTNLCSAVSQRLQRQGLHVAGMLSKSVFFDGRKGAIDAVHIRSGERRRLACAREHCEPIGPLETRAWTFNPDVMAWGDETLRTSVPCQVLFVDELGTLEFERGEGWLAGLQVLDEGQFDAAFVVIRPELLEQAQARWPRAQVIHVRRDLENQIEELVQMVRSELGMEPGEATGE
jgi:nucleoside-triphosphatase THEP1